MQQVLLAESRLSEGEERKPGLVRRCWCHQHGHLVLVRNLYRARWLHPGFPIDLHGEPLSCPYDD